MFTKKEKSLTGTSHEQMKRDDQTFLQTKPNALLSRLNMLNFD